MTKCFPILFPIVLQVGCSYGPGKLPPQVQQDSSDAGLNQSPDAAFMETDASLPQDMAVSLDGAANDAALPPNFPLPAGTTPISLQAVEKRYNTLYDACGGIRPGSNREARTEQQIRVLHDGDAVSGIQVSGFYPCLEGPRTIPAYTDPSGAVSPVRGTLSTTLPPRSGWYTAASCPRISDLSRDVPQLSASYLVNSDGSIDIQMTCDWTISYHPLEHHFAKLVATLPGGACKPASFSCSGEGATCGTISDSCGTKINCAACSSPLVCDQANHCVTYP